MIFVGEKKKIETKVTGIMIGTTNENKITMVYIKKEKPNGNITADRKAYNMAYYQANKVRILSRQADYYQDYKVEVAERKAHRELDPKPVGYVEETGEIILWVGIEVIREQAYRKKLRQEMIWADMTEDFSGLKGYIYEVGYE